MFNKLSRNYVGKCTKPRARESTPQPDTSRAGHEGLVAIRLDCEKTVQNHQNPRVVTILKIAC
jgi:hypothetical protein